MATMVLTRPPANASQPAMAWLDHYPRGVDWHMPLKVAPLYRLLDDAVARFGHLNCTNFLGRTLTYSEIGEQVDRRSEEHTSELQSQSKLVCRLLLETKNLTRAKSPV